MKRAAGGLVVWIVDPASAMSARVLRVPLPAVKVGGS